MVKPQFEVGKDRLGSGGVVRDPALRCDACRGGRGGRGDLGWGTVAAWWRRRCRARAAMWSTSCTCDAAPPADADTVDRHGPDRRRGGPVMTDRRGAAGRAHRPRLTSTPPPARCGDGLAAAGVELLAMPGEGTASSTSTCSTRDHRSAVELVLALGGDGTLLRAAEGPGPLRVPVLGVNSGRVGFLAEADADHLDLVLRCHRRPRTIRGRRVTVRMTVDVTMELNGTDRRPLLGAERGQRREGHQGADPRRGGRGRRPRRVGLRLRRRDVRDADRLDGIRILRRRADHVAGRRGVAGRAVERACAVRPAAGGLTAVGGHRAHRPAGPGRDHGLRRPAHPRGAARVAGAHAPR